MRLSIARLFAFVSTLACSVAVGTSAEAANFGGQSASNGFIRCASVVSQTTDATVVANSWVEVTHCSGWVEFIPINAVTATQFEAVGTFARLDGYVASATNTTMKFTVHTPGDDVAGFRIVGGSDSICAFDRKQPSPGTAGSGLGLDVTPIAMSGAWTVYAHLTDAVALCPAAPVRDLHMTLIMRFTGCFRYGDYLSWKVDTDKIG